MLPPYSPYQWPGMGMPAHMQRGLFAGMKSIGISSARCDRDERLGWASDVLGFELESFSDLSPEDAGDLLAEIRLTVKK
jgi:hypothetical protein